MPDDRQVLLGHRTRSTHVGKAILLQSIEAIDTEQVMLTIDEGDVLNVSRYEPADALAEAVALLRDAIPFIGYQADVRDLVERAEAFVEGQENLSDV